MRVVKDELIRMGEMIPAMVGIYCLRDGNLVPLYISPELPGVLDMQSDEYEEETKGDALKIVLPGDRDMVLAAVHDLVADNLPVDVFYRVKHKTRGFDWVHAKARFCGKMDNDPVLFATFANSSVETDIYQDILDSTERSIYVCDRNTYEVLYANAPAQEAYGESGDPIVGTICHRSIRGNAEPCDFCPMHSSTNENGAGYEKIEHDGDTYKRITGRPARWCGHDAFLFFVDDVTALKQAERDAVKNRNMYEAAVEDAKLVVWEYDIVHHRVIMSNNDFTQHDYRKFGIPKIVEDAPRSLVPFIADESVDDFLDLYRRVDAGEQKASCEVWYKILNYKQPRCMRISYTTEFDADGKPVRAFGLAQNITAQKTAEKRYAEAFRQLSLTHPHAIASFHLNLSKNQVGGGVSDLDFVLKQQESGTADGYFAEFAKLIADDGVKSWFFDTFNREKLIEGFKQGKTELSFEYPIIYDDGARHWREGLLYMIQNPTTGDVEGVTYAVDIDARKYNEMALKALSREVYAFLILLDMKTGMIITGGETEDGATERYDNQPYTPAMMAALQNMMPVETLDESIAVHSLDNIKKRLEREGAFEASFVTKDGHHLHWRFTYADKNESIALIMREDITNVSRREQARIRELDNARRSQQRVTSLLQSILDTAPVAMF